MWIRVRDGIASCRSTSYIATSRNGAVTRPTICHCQVLPGLGCHTVALAAVSADCASTAGAPAVPSAATNARTVATRKPREVMNPGCLIRPSTDGCLTRPGYLAFVSRHHGHQQRAPG